MSTPPPIEHALRQTRTKLLDLRSGEAVWKSKLSASALSTATALVALVLAKRESRRADARLDGLIEQGMAWLATHANADGGWGDTIRSRSNLSTTTLVWAAFGIWPDAARTHQPAISAGEKWLAQRIGKLDARNLAAKILECYETDLYVLGSYSHSLRVGGTAGFGTGGLAAGDSTAVRTVHSSPGMVCRAPAAGGQLRAACTYRGWLRATFPCAVAQPIRARPALRGGGAGVASA